MSPSVFFVSLTILLILFLLRKKIVGFLNNSLNFPIEIKVEWFIYLLVIGLVVVLAAGVLMGVTDNSFGNVSVGGGIENLNDAPSRKPHRMFDINFNIFNF
ncbi:MAG: hypothetical protein IE909_09340 [Campylobacterales bacterium]|nr:hypothetical protein [Campylobacterales bacterium]